MSIDELTPEMRRLAFSAKASERKEAADVLGLLAANVDTHVCSVVIAVLLRDSDKRVRESAFIAVAGLTVAERYPLMPILRMLERPESISREVFERELKYYESLQPRFTSGIVQRSE